MSLFQRAHDIVSAKANKALDSAENPNEMLDYSYEQMLDHLTRVRQALVDMPVRLRGPHQPFCARPAQPGDRDR
jgi:phage shock protein A